MKRSITTISSCAEIRRPRQPVSTKAHGYDAQPGDHSLSIRPAARRDLMAPRFPLENDTLLSNRSRESIDCAADIPISGTARDGTMELRHLRYFAAVAEHLNFTRAAETVHVTQSTLSHQIKQLETEIGPRLFDRIGKRIVITEAGEQLLGKVKHALSEIDDGLRAVRGAAPQLS